MKKVLKFSGYVIVVMLLLLVAYVLKYSMGTAERFVINPQVQSPSLLLATQQSEYKDEVVRQVTKFLQNAQYNIQVIDVNELSEFYDSDYNNVVIIHTWEYYRAPKAVRKFVNKSKYPDKIFTLATSGDGHYHLDNVDGITSASRMLSAEDDAQKIINWVEEQSGSIP